MVQRSQRLQAVLSLEERKEQEALDRMGQARQQVDALRQQVNDLEQYQQEYRNQIRTGQQGVVPVSRLQAWHAFIGQLDQVIQAQEHQLKQAEQAFEARRQEWLQAWERRRGMEKYIETCRQQEQRAADLKEQKLADEAAGRAFARRQR